MSHPVREISKQSDSPNRRKTIAAQLGIVFITTGGSIDKSYSPHVSSFEVADPVLQDVLNDGLVEFTYEVKPIFKKDSLEMTIEDRQKIRRTVEGRKERRIIITHGTDTIVETGLFLKGIKDKVIVLTGAFTPIRFKHTDAVLNLGMAIAAVQTLPPAVYVAINGTVSPIESLHKDVESQVFRFETRENRSLIAGQNR